MTNLKQNDCVFFLSFNLELLFEFWIGFCLYLLYSCAKVSRDILKNYRVIFRYFSVIPSIPHYTLNVILGTWYFLPWLFNSVSLISNLFRFHPDLTYSSVNPEQCLMMLRIYRRKQPSTIIFWTQNQVLVKLCCWEWIIFQLEQKMHQIKNG